MKELEHFIRTVDQAFVGSSQLPANKRLAFRRSCVVFAYDPIVQLIDNLYMCTHTFMSVRMHVCMHVCMYACMHGVYACVYVCMHACMHACMHLAAACTHICMRVRACVYACEHASVRACTHERAPLRSASEAHRSTQANTNALACLMNPASYFTMTWYMYKRRSARQTLGV